MYKGRLLGPCKHKWVVAKVKNIASFDVVPTESPTMRQTYWYLGTGNIKTLDWFLPLQHERVSEGLETSFVSGEMVDCSVREEVLGDVVAEQVVNVGDVDLLEEVNVEDESKRELEEVKTKFSNCLRVLEGKVLGRIENDLVGYGKAVEAFAQTVNRLPASSDSALHKALFSFSKTVTQVCIVVYLHP